MATPLTIIQLRCPTCGEPSWVMDHIVRGIHLMAEERPFPERTYMCRHCSYHGAGFGFLQKAPSGFLQQPHPMFPMGRKAFRFWLDILRENFPDFPSVQGDTSDFRPNLPTLLQQAAGALTVMSYILDSRQERRRYGNQAFKMDRVCLAILFEHHLRRIFDLPPSDTAERLLAHIDGADVEILSDATLRRLLLPVFGEAKKVVKERPTFEQWKSDPYFAIGLDAYHRFGHQDMYPPMPETEQWHFVDTRELPASEREHTRLWWPVEDVL